MAANSRFAVASHILVGLGLEPEALQCSERLASSVNTNPVVVRRILSDLQAAGLIETVKGKAGGARLAKAPERISLGDVFFAVEGKDSLFAYNPAPANKHCPLSCVMKGLLEPIFEGAQSAMMKELKRLKLSELIDQARARGVRQS